MVDTTYQPKVYREHGGDRMVVASGGSLDVESGGEMDIESGAAFKIAGTDIAAELARVSGLTATAAEINRVADLTGRIVTSTDAGTLALTAALHGDRIVNFNDADGTITLPSATGSGVRFEVYIGTAATAMSITVAPSTNEEFSGGVNGVDDDADAAYAWKAEDDDDTISLNGAATGGKVGDWFRFTDIATGVWLVEGFITQSGGLEATPFSAAITS